MWQIFYGLSDYDRNTINYGGATRHRVDAEKIAENLFWDMLADRDRCEVDDPFAAAVHFEEKKTTVWGGLNPFDGEWDQTDIPDPEWQGPSQKLGGIDQATVILLLREKDEDFLNGVVERNQLLDRLLHVRPYPGPGGR